MKTIIDKKMFTFVAIVIQILIAVIIIKPELSNLAFGFGCSLVFFIIGVDYSIWKDVKTRAVNSLTVTNKNDNM